MKGYKRVLLGIFLFLASYLSVGYFLHLIVFPEIKPDVENYFQPGDVISSEVGGTTITVERQEGEHLHVTLEVAPQAEGPPLHVHTGFEEVFNIESGRITLRVNGEEKVLEAGETFTVPPGTAHKPYNPFDEPTVISGVTMPAQFVVYLNQAYGYLEEDPEIPRRLRLFSRWRCSTSISIPISGEGPPVFVQKVQNFLLLPLARLMGYRSYYNKYRI
ncbi:MAG: cupin domain-containing protein [Balneolaceae bacterium]|nr:cupin domain-containing protein [Balneolaceae bacterium]